MRRIILFMVGVVCACVVMLIGATSAQALSLEFKSSGSASSPSAEVWVMDRGMEEIGGFDITIGYDPLLLSFNNIIFGSYLGDLTLFEADAGTSLQSGGTTNAYEVSFLATTELLKLQPDAFLLFTMNFDAIGTGTSQLAFTDALISNDLGDPIIPTDLKNGSIDVNPVPEPNNLLLLCAGLGILMVWQRKFRS